MNQTESPTPEVSPPPPYSVLHELFEKLPDAPLAGFYDPKTQTWSHRKSIQFSPVKNNKEM